MPVDVAYWIVVVGGWTIAGMVLGISARSQWLRRILIAWGAVALLSLAIFVGARAWAFVTTDPRPSFGSAAAAAAMTAAMAAGAILWLAAKRLWTAPLLLVAAVAGGWFAWLLLFPAWSAATIVLGPARLRHAVAEIPSTPA